MSDHITRQVRRMADLAYCAALIDQGSMMVSRRHDRPHLLVPRITVRLHNARERDQGEKVAEILGVGSRSGSNAHDWRYGVAGAKGVLAALDEVQPYLKLLGRKAQALRPLCELMVEDQAARGSFNDRSLSPQQIRQRDLLVDALEMTL